jgi:hypothetical protein
MIDTLKESFSTPLITIIFPPIKATLMNPKKKSQSIRNPPNPKNLKAFKDSDSKSFLLTEKLPDIETRLARMAYILNLIKFIFITVENGDKTLLNYLPKLNFPMKLNKTFRLMFL